MKVAVRLTVEINPELWDEVYGIQPADIRDDVRAYVLDLVQCSAAADAGAITLAVLR